MTKAVAAATTAILLAFGVSAKAAELKVLSSNALKSVIEELAPQFEKASGHKLVIVWGAAVPLRGQIEKGEVFDATILTTPAIDALIAQAKLDKAT
jgi:molybdate transport system substrate-binding protein